MQEMVRNLLAAMRDDILSRPWMSDDTKEKAMAKIATFNPKIGYPDKWKDYSQRRDTQRCVLRDHDRGRAAEFVVEDDRDPSESRWTGALGHDAADFRRVLQLHC